MNKVFIIGLPRTGTTSICKMCLDFGFHVAHTAYTDKTFEFATVLADTPMFADYKALDLAYPNSKFVLLERELTDWLPSIKQLLQRMYENVTRTDGGFNSIIKRCYQQTFSPFTFDNINDDAFLSQAYVKHQQEVLHYFNQQPSKLLSINIQQSNAVEELSKFLSIKTDTTHFEHLNKGGKVTAWKDIEHPKKVASTRKGRATALPYSL
ncbi:sulfotransferase [Thalassotalea hakodatensis]|uniref:sulfotransferase n=1 Tax=Thalassotalea hakodatensis TaxID=3030492 RepID=UPI00257282BC|nr:sulfotransferase [Thalassotalea hakodatensis]